MMAGHQREYPMSPSSLHKLSPQQRLERNSSLDPETGCRRWTKAHNQCGYGVASMAGKTLLAHRAAWIAKHGPIPKGLYICHRCDVRDCINPDHLFLGTPKENMVDKMKKMGLRTEQIARQAPSTMTAPMTGLLRLQLGGQEIVSQLQVISVRPIPETE
jgi:hypothetical protein